uniref:Uncharacterized protein n=1 Tax=Anguilla anguilla TaxID=7936 RepID=A0A0E9R7Z8_ANGAN
MNSFIQPTISKGHIFYHNNWFSVCTLP